MTIKLEVGKEYQTREGSKAKVLAIDPERERFVGVVYDGDDAEAVAWQVCGLQDLDKKLGFDIVADWVEPEPDKKRGSFNYSDERELAAIVRYLLLCQVDSRNISKKWADTVAGQLKRDYDLRCD